MIHRFVPRANLEINGWWMCDYGRFLADGLNSREIDAPLRRTEDGECAVSWESALAALAALLRTAPKPLVVASANFSNEALYSIKRNLQESSEMMVVVPIHTGDQRRRWSSCSKTTLWIVRLRPGRRVRAPGLLGGARSRQHPHDRRTAHLPRPRAEGDRTSRHPEPESMHPLHPLCPVHHRDSETDDLVMKSRGNHSYIDTFDGAPLDNPGPHAWPTSVSRRADG